MAAMLAVTVPPELHDGSFSSARWLLDGRNVALRIGPDLGMFEYFGPGVFVIHTWFRSRGLEALKRAELMLDEMVENYGARVFRGEIPQANRKMRLFARWCGFHVTGEAIRPWGKVILTELSHWEHTDSIAPAIEAA